MSEQRLYGRPGAEVMHFDPVTVYESELDDAEHPERAEIEEWTVQSPLEHLPSGEMLLEWISEWTAENGEVSADFDIVPRTPEVKAAVEFLLSAIANKITWRQAEKHVASHWITWDENNKPLLDGEPLYR